MTTIIDLTMGQYGDDAMSDINDNFDALNAGKLEVTDYDDATTSAAGKTRLSVAPASASIPIAVGDNDPRVPTVAQVGYIPTSDEKDALDGTGTPSVSNKFVTNDTLTAAAAAITSQSGITDTTFASGEAITAGQAVFIESVPTFAQSTSVQNVGDVSGNTRISFPIFGTGVAGTTFNISLKKTVSPSATFSFRIETDNAGSPSGTIVTNGSGTIAAASVTTSFVDTTLTLAGSVTLTSGVRYHLVLFAGTYGSETVNGTNYFNVGYNTNNTTTRPAKTWNGSVWSAVAATTFCYASSTIFLSRVLSLTDSDFSYKVDWFGLSTETVAVGLFPRITTSGVNGNQTGLTYASNYYLSGTPGTISTTIGTNGALIGSAISTTQIQITDKNNPPLIRQDIPQYQGATPTLSYFSAATTGVSNTEALYSGSALSATSAGLFRWQRMRNGSLRMTHVVFPTSNAGTGIVVVVIGDYVYALSNNGGSPQLTRYNKADLTGAQVMTISGTALTLGTGLFTNGTDLFNVYTAGQAKIYTLSGTTFTSGADTAFTSAVATDSYWSDGTSVYTAKGGGTNACFKWAIAGGARTTGTTIYPNQYNLSGTDSTVYGCIKDAYSQGEILTMTQNTNAPTIPAKLIPVTLF